MPICTKCNIEKNIDEFAWRIKEKIKQKRCKICTRLASKKHYYNNKKQYFNKNDKREKDINNYIQEYKKTKHCEKCGENRYYILQFHHLKDKKADISMLYRKGWSFDKIKKEIEKCIILCSNCHIELHFLDRIKGHIA